MTKKEETRKPGVGLDIGTAFIVRAAFDEAGKEISYNTLRDAFFKVPKDENTIEMFTRLGVSYTSDDTYLYILGEGAIEVANLFREKVSRPMANGVISTEDNDAIDIMEVLLSKVLGKPVVEGETCIFTVPAMPLNIKDSSEFNTEYHEDKLSQIIASLGYTPKPINEALCIAYDALQDHRLTGVSCSFGAGQINIATVMLGVAGRTFSIIGSGDYIDSRAANQFKMTPTQFTKLKETADYHLVNSLKDPKIDRKIEALCLFYRRIIENAVENLALQLKDDQPDVPPAIVIAGGTSLANGFLELFKDVVKNSSLQCGEIILVDNPLYSVARGALMRSSSIEAKRTKQ